MFPCCHIITNGNNVGKFCGKINCKEHKYYIKVKSDESYCPIIKITGKNKGKACCNKLVDNNVCKIHKNSKVPSTNKNDYSECYYNYNINDLLTTEHSGDFKNSNFKYIKHYCNIRTKNKNGLCSFISILVLLLVKFKYTAMIFSIKSNTYRKYLDIKYESFNSL